MAESNPGKTAKDYEFHQVVLKGTLEELRTALAAGADVNAPGHCERTALIFAIEVRDVEKMKLLLAHGADSEQTDEFNNTPLRCAVESNFADGVKLLLSLGVDLGYHPKYPLKKVDRSLPPYSEILDELKAVYSEEEWQVQREEDQKLTSRIDEEPALQRDLRPVIEDGQSAEVLQLLIDAGDDLSQAPNEIRRNYIALPTTADFQASPAEYSIQKKPAMAAQTQNEWTWCSGAT